MSIKINRSTLLEDILQFKEVFSELMANIEQKGSAHEFDTRLYQQLYFEKICTEADGYQKDRLSIASLTENGIFVHSNPSAGVTALQPLIVNLFRFMEEKKTVTMSHVEFENIRVQFEAMQRKIIKNDQVEGFEYTSAIKPFSALISTTINELRQNIDALRQSVVELGEDYRRHQETGNTQSNLLDLFERITDLHQHYAMPCYEFIDQDATSSDGLTLTQSLKSLISFHSKKGKTDVSLSLMYDLQKVTAYYKDIEALVKQLSTYSNYLYQDRERYLAIDNAFERVMVDVRALRHGKRNNRTFTAETPFLMDYSALDGLNPKPMHQQRLDWIDNVSILRFDEWLRSNTGIEKNVSKDLLRPISEQGQPDELRRAKVTMDVMRKLRAPKEGIEDVVEFVHQWMRTEIGDYEFIDLLSGVGGFYSIYPYSTLVRKLEKKRLIHDGYYYDYLVVAKEGRQNA